MNELTKNINLKWNSIVFILETPKTDEIKASLSVTENEVLIIIELSRDVKMFIIKFIMTDFEVKSYDVTSELLIIKV